MQVVTSELVKDKKVLLRLDIDVPLGKGTGDRLQVTDDFRLIAGMATLELCLESASQTIILGHIGRPHFVLSDGTSRGKPDEESLVNLNVGPIYDWLVEHGFGDEFKSNKLKLLENLRFEQGEEEADVSYAQKLAALGNFYVNEAFASHHPSASTTILPKYLPHAAGLQFAKEVDNLTRVKNNPKHPLIVIIGGIKVEDKLPAALALSKVAEYILIGGKIASELAGPVARQPHTYPTSPINIGAGPPHGAPRLAPPAILPENILLAELNEGGTDINDETIAKWAPIISSAKMIVWNGPLGRIEATGYRVQGIGGEELGSARGTYDVAKMIVESGAESIVGGGDTVGFLGQLGLLERFGWVSTGGGAMLELFETGTLPTIEALA